MKKIVILLVLAAAVAGGVFGYEHFFGGRGGQGGAVVLSGNIEVTDIELSFRIPGVIRERKVDEGDKVKQGDTVALLDDRDQVREIELRTAEVRQADAALRQLVAGSRPQEIAGAEASARQAQERLAALVAGSRPQEIAAAEAVVRRATAQAANAKVELDRQKQLHEKGAITDRDLDTAKAANDVASAQLAEAAEQLKLVKEGPREEDVKQSRAALQEAEARLALVREGPRAEEIDQARARLAQANQALNLAKAQLGYTTLASPVTGLVLSKNLESGEHAAPGTPVLTVADITKVWLRGYVGEPEFGLVKLGQRAEVTADTWPGRKFAGRVSFISQEAEFTPKNVETKRERVKLVYRIKIDLSNPKMELKPGMPADAEIFVNEAH